MDSLTWPEALVLVSFFAAIVAVTWLMTRD